LAVLAGEQLKMGDREQARTTLKTALSLSPNHLDAARLEARLLDEDRDTRALDYHLILLASGEDTLEDDRRAAHSAAMHGKDDMAMRVAVKISNLTDDPAYPHLIQARLHGGRGEIFEQERALRAALAARESLETFDALAVFLLSRQDELDLHKAEIEGLLQRIAAKDSTPRGLAALRTALTAGLLEEEDYSSWLIAYRAHPAATGASRMFADELEIRRNPATRALVVDRLVKRSLGQPFGERLPEARWLMQQNENQALQRLLPLPEAFQNREAFEFWVRAGLARKNWADVDAALVHPSNPLTGPQTDALRALTAQSQGDAAGATALWTRALEKCRAQPEPLLELMAQVLQANEWTLFDKHSHALLENPDWALKSMGKLIPVALGQRDSTKMKGFFERCLQSRFLAHDPLLRDYAACTNLMLGEEVSLEELETRVRDYPSAPGFRTTYALALLRSGLKAKAAYELEAPPKGDFSELQPVQLAIVAAVFAANDRLQEARALQAGIPRQRLTRQEEKFLDQYLGPVGKAD
jgi:hypothetical protein